MKKVPPIQFLCLLSQTVHGSLPYRPLLCITYHLKLCKVKFLLQSTTNHQRPLHISLKYGNNRTADYSVNAFCLKPRHIYPDFRTTRLCLDDSPYIVTGHGSWLAFLDVATHSVLMIKQVMIISRL